MSRILREIAEHWEDAHASALKEGIEQNAAKAQANAAIGDPHRLATSFVAQFRCGTWFGRHPWATALLLPTLLAPVAFAVIALPVSGLETLFKLSEKDFWKHPPYVTIGVFIAWGLYCAATSLVPLALWWWAWRKGLGWRIVWLLWAGSLLSASFRFFEASEVKRHIVLGMRFPPAFDTHFIIVLLLHMSLGVLLFMLTRHPQPSPVEQPFHEN